MGACLSNDEKLPENFFVVRNIHDDHRKFPKGLIEVTAIELKYRDAQSGDEWVWPLKYLRKYGCDRDIFSFEAGRKCPGGEGLYAFSTKKASQLFDLVARNIDVGGLGEEGVGGVLSPPDVASGIGGASVSPISPPPVPLPNPPPPPPVSDPPSHPPTGTTRKQPEYLNLPFKDGQTQMATIPNGHASSASPPSLLPKERRDSASATPPPPKLNYTEVALAKPSKSNLEIEEGEEEKRVSYSEIDLKETEEYNQQMARRRAESAHPLPDIGNPEFQRVTPSERPIRNGGSRSRVSRGSSSRLPSASSSSSSTSSLVPSSGKGNVAPPTIPEDREAINSPHFQPNYVNVTPDPSLATTPTPSITPTVSATTVATPENYVNLKPDLSLASVTSDAYMNITPQPSLGGGSSSGGGGLGLGRRKTEPTLSGREPTSTYANLPIQAAATSPPRVTGNLMYATLELPHTSTPKSSKGDISEENLHMTMNFGGKPAGQNRTAGPTMNRSRSTNSPPPTEISFDTDRARLPTVTGAEGSASGARCQDDTMVNYTTINLDYVEALRKTKEQRDEENRLRAEKEREEEEEERKKREENENTGKKKKKGKKKNRRNSHN